MKKTLFSLLLVFAVAASLCGCRKDDVEIQMSTFEYTYSVSPELLDYFDITVHYIDDDGTQANIPLNRTQVSFSTYQVTVPVEDHVWFTAKPTGKRPTERVDFKTEISISVDVIFGDGTKQTRTSTQTNEYTATPETFDSWANTFITRMSYGYYTYVTLEGFVNFSTE